MDFLFVCSLEGGFDEMTESTTCLQSYCLAPNSIHSEAKLHFAWTIKRITQVLSELQDGMNEKPIAAAGLVFGASTKLQPTAAGLFWKQARNSLILSNVSKIETILFGGMISISIDVYDS